MTNRGKLKAFLFLLLAGMLCGRQPVYVGINSFEMLTCVISNSYAQYCVMMIRV